ncbi:MAG: PhoH family protein [Planctomycetota bacterium]
MPDTATIDLPDPASASGTGSSKAPSVKTFVLDTNVLLHNSAALFLFADNHVVVPFAVVEELDTFKKNNDDNGRAAREVIRQLDRLRQKGKLDHGVEWNGHGGTIRVAFANDHDRPEGIRLDSADNRIIAVAWALQKRGHRAILVTKDINVRVRTDALGIPTEDFEAQKVDADRMYRGYEELSVPGELIDRLYDEKQLEIEAVLPHLIIEDPDAGSRELDLHANQFVQLRNQLDDSHTGLARRLADTDHLIPVTSLRKPVHGIMARNVQQTMALDLLLDDDVQLITLLGTAGSGKTLLALAAGLTKTFSEERYDKLLVARPIMPMGRDIGYLPGDKDEKLSAWMQPIFDNLEYLMTTRGVGTQHAESKTADKRVEQLMTAGKIVLEPLTYIRGRSIPHQYIIVDEAQNLTPHEVKTIVSRVGEGTKIILTGDVNQIDNPYLDTASNGLAYLVERLKGHALVGHVTLAKSERSELASLAAERL